MSVKNDDLKASNTTEERNYVLNPERTQKKLLEAAEREGVKIIETAGGITLKMNSEIYREIKDAAKKFYGSGKLDKIKCEITNVRDKKGNRVEKKYSLTEGGACIYTLNLYHTKYSALANGKHAQRFRDIDFPEILNIAGIDIRPTKPITKDECLDENTDPKQLYAEVIRPSEEMSNVEGVVTLSDVENLPNIKSSELLGSCIPDKLFDELSEVKGILLVLKDEICQLRSNLSAHVETTASQLSQIRDEISNIKSHSTVIHPSQATHSKIEEVQN